MGIKKKMKKIMKARKSKPSKKVLKKNMQFFSKLELLNEYNSIQENVKRNEGHNPVPINEWNFQRFLEVIKDANTTFDDTVLTKGVKSISVNHVIITFNDDTDPYEFMSSPDVNMGKVKEILFGQEMETEDSNDFNNQADFIDPICRD